MALLEVKNLTKNFGGLTAVGDVNIELGASELVGLIGPNGAGKTTLFNCINEDVESDSGTIYLEKNNTKNLIMKYLYLEFFFIQGANLSKIYIFNLKFY